MKIMVTSFKRSHAHTATLSVPNPAAGHHQPTPLPEIPGHSWASLGHSLVCALQESISQSCKLWQLCGGVNGDLLQKGLCHTQVCCTQSPCSCGRPLLTCTSTGDTQTQFCLSLCEVSGSWCTQCLFELSEHLWWEWGLILNMNSPISCEIDGETVETVSDFILRGLQNHCRW